MPHGVVNLLSSLRFHGLTTQHPFEVQTAIENSARRPQTETIPLRIVYTSGDAFKAGVKEHEIGQVPAHMCAAAKTVADCFKFRHKFGVDVAIEAPRDYRRHPDFDANALWRYAKICRVFDMMRLYMAVIA